MDERSAVTQWADWLELTALFSASSTISRSDVRELMELRAVSDDEVGAMLDDAFNTIADRESVLGPTYPLERARTRIGARRPRQQCVSFSFLLALGTRHLFSASIRVDDEAARLFEYVTAAAIARYLNGQSVRIGAPREAPVPTSFRHCLEFLGRLMGESSRMPMNPRAQDENVDVVGWSPFADGKPGQLIVLAQCKTQRDWDQALDSVNLDVWNEQMAWGVTPVRAFAFPFVLDERRHSWKYVAKQGGIPFDRLRLSGLARDEDLSEDVRERIARWCDAYALGLPDPSSLT